MMKMSIEDFTECLEDYLQTFCGPDEEICHDFIEKINGGYDGITIKGQDRVYPVFPIEKLYDLYCDGQPMEHIYGLIKDGIRRAKEMEVQMDFLKDYNLVKKRLYIRLINMEKNKENLTSGKNVIFKDLDGLAIIYSIFIQNAGGCVYSTPVMKQMLEDWGIDRDTLHRDAMDNAVRLFKPAISKRPLPGLYRLGLNNSAKKDALLVSNELGNYGASAILYPEVLKRANEEFEKGFVIVPISVTSVMLVDKMCSLDMLKIVLKRVNDLREDEDEFLSDDLYEYSGGKLKKIA